MITVLRGNCNLSNAAWFDVLATGHGVAKLSHDNLEALELCRTCPVQSACLDSAVNEPVGKWSYPHIRGGRVFGVADRRFAWTS